MLSDPQHLTISHPDTAPECKPATPSTIESPPWYIDPPHFESINLDGTAPTEPAADTGAPSPSGPASPSPPSRPATPGEPDREAVERLLLSLFDAAGLRRFVSYGPQGAEIVAEDLPGENAPAAAQAHAAVSAWIRRGLVTSDLFACLTAQREHRAADIEAIRRQWETGR